MSAPPASDNCACWPTQMAPPKPVVVLIASLPLNVLLFTVTRALAKLANSAAGQGRVQIAFGATAAHRAAGGRGVGRADQQHANQHSGQARLNEAFHGAHLTF